MFAGTLGSDVHRAQITIPISSDVGTTVGTLFAAANLPPAPKAFTILATLPDGVTARGAFIIASRRPGQLAFAATDYTTHGRHVAAGVEYQSAPGDRDWDSAIRAAAGGAFVANIEAVY